MLQLSTLSQELLEKSRRACYPVNGCCQAVHKELGPFLNEYMYQEALAIALSDASLPFDKEYYFTAQFRGHTLKHRHFVDFRVDGNIFIECKAVTQLHDAHRQQLWNYMRLARVPLGILWNFHPVRDQSEHYYLDLQTNTLYYF